MNTSHKVSSAKDLSTLWAWNKLLDRKTCQLTRFQLFSFPIREFPGFIPKALQKEGESHSLNKFGMYKLSGIKL